MELEDKLFLLVRDKNAADLRRWLSAEGRNVDINPRNDQAQTPLYWACESDDPELVQVLVDHRADVNIAEGFGFTPLHLAAYLGHTGITKVLLASKASVKATNNEGSTALHLAAKQDNVEVVKALIAGGVDLLVKDNDGQTAIQLCDKKGTSFAVLMEKLVLLKQKRDQESIMTEEVNRTVSAAPPAPSTAAATEPVNKTQMDKMSKALALLTANIDVERARVAELEKKLQLADEELTKWKKSGAATLCKQCLREPRDRVFLPCMHLHYCNSCAKPMQQCGTCHMLIAGKVPARLE